MEPTALTINHLPNEYLVAILDYLPLTCLMRLVPQVCTHWHALRAVVCARRRAIMIHIGWGLNLAAQTITTYGIECRYHRYSCLRLKHRFTLIKMGIGSMAVPDPFKAEVFDHIAALFPNIESVSASFWSNTKIMLELT